MPDKRNEEKNAAQGAGERPNEELQCVNSERSAPLNETVAKLGLPVGVEDIEIEFPRSHERALAVELLDDTDRPALKPRKID